MPADTALVYLSDDKSKSMRDTIVYSLQWLFIMFYGVVWGYALVGVGLEFTGKTLASYMGAVVLMIGVSTLVQAVLGHKMAMMSAPNVLPSLAILAAFAVGGKEYALASFNAYIIAGIVVAIIGALGLLKYLEKVWTPLVLGGMVLMIGLVVSSVGMSFIAGTSASWPFFVGIGLALLCGWLSISGRGFLATIPVLITIVLGYAIFMAAGNFDWDLVNSVPTIVYPTLFPFGTNMPPADLIIMMILVNLFCALMLFGNTGGYANVIKAKALEGTQLKKTVVIFGLVEGALPGLLGVPSTVPYAENIGIVLLTRVAARIFIIIASIAFIVLSFFGQMGGLMAAMPKPVAGAILLGVASTCIGIGANIWHQNPKYETREILITSFAVFFAYGISLATTEFFDSMPRLISVFFKNPIILVILVAIALEQLVFRARRTPEEAPEVAASEKPVGEPEPTSP